MCTLQAYLLYNIIGAVLDPKKPSKEEDPYSISPSKCLKQSVPLASQTICIVGKEYEQAGLSMIQ